MRQSRLQQDVLRRADAGVDDVSVNGGTPIGGSIAIDSPMATQTGQTIRIDNANAKGHPASTYTAPDTDNFNAFDYFPEAGGAPNIPAPVAPTGNFQGRKITITFIFTNGIGGIALPITFDNSAAGYQFADAASPLGPTKAQFDALIAACPAGAFCAVKVGFEYLGYGAAKDWVAVALGGWYT